jgi:hypothetical protein
VASEPEPSEEDQLADEDSDHHHHQVTTIGDEDGYLTSTITYETPITTVEYLTGDDAALLVDASIQQHHQRLHLSQKGGAGATSSTSSMKTERANEIEPMIGGDDVEIEYDDYEMQERLSNNENHMKSFNEDPNDSSS